MMAGRLVHVAFNQLQYDKPADIRISLLLRVPLHATPEYTPQ